MKIAARIEYASAERPDSWDDEWGICLPLNHVICRDLDGTAHTIGEFVWPWTAYTPNRKKLLLHFCYWKPKRERIPASLSHVTPERENYMRELQFLMTRQIYYGYENSSKTLEKKLTALRYVARFAEAKSYKVFDILTQSTLLDACGASLPDHVVEDWMAWLTFLRQLDPETHLGFTLATPKRWRELVQRKKEYRGQSRQHAPLPTRIYAALINNLAAELDDIERHESQLLAALREAVPEYRRAKATETEYGIRIGTDLIAKHGLVDYLQKRGYTETRLRSLAAAVGEIFHICKLQIHVFSGMRNTEAGNLPFHCMASERGGNERKHCLILGTTTKLNKGRRLRTKWVTTERDGFRAIRIAQLFATVIYEIIGVAPNATDDLKDEFPLFPSTDYLPWMRQSTLDTKRIAAAGTTSFYNAADSLKLRLCPVIEESDLAELEEIDPFRAWSEEPDFAVRQPWNLTTHQLRRSLAIYANASGLVRFSSLRRQLQHITREMAMYYARGSTFCKNFIADDPVAFKKHIAVDWQDGTEEAEMLAFVRDVLNSPEPMFGGAGTFYERQRERGEVMSRADVAKQIKAGLLSYQEGPLGGCTRSGGCDNRKGLGLINIACATDGCRNLIGKHSKIVRTIQLKRAAMAHITPGSITEAMEQEELEALERVEREWRPEEQSVLAASRSGRHA